MRTIEEIKQEILKTGNKLYEKERQLADADFSGDKEIQDLRNEINNDIWYIKNIYNQLLTIRANAEFLLRRNDDLKAKETSKKVHQAFLLLIENNKHLDAKIVKYRDLLAKRNELMQECIGNTLGKEISQLQDQLEELRKELRIATATLSESARVKDKIIENLKQHQQEIAQIEEQIKRKEADSKVGAPLCNKCRTEMVLCTNPKDQDVYWKCPQASQQDKHGTKRYQGDKDLVKHVLQEIIDLKQRKEQLENAPSSIVLSPKEKNAFQHANVKIEQHPYIFEKSYNNYLFQSLAIPCEINAKDHFIELLKHSRFRIFTQLPQEKDLDDKTRTVYSLALRLLNRGVILSSNTKTEVKIKRHFSGSGLHAFLDRLNQYIAYQSPYNQYEEPREKEFAEHYFPKLLGNAWATYVYAQLPITTLLAEKESKKFKKQRVDFFVCYNGKRLVIELDGDEHKLQEENDNNRDTVLRGQGCDVLRIPNNDVDNWADWIFTELKKRLGSSASGSLMPYSEKHLVACKIVHQISIAIIKMLEEGHISSRCNLNLEINSDLFSAEEQQLLLLFATEEVSELIENFAKLYGVTIDLDFFDRYYENYWIKIGDGDSNRNSIVIRDIVLPLNYLCSIHPFALIMPEKNAVTEDILEYFLQYVYGYAQFKTGQYAAIRRALCQEESIVLLPTGSGKSVIYQLSAMLLPGITVVISPLRALIEDQVNNLADKGINNVAAIFSADKNSKEEMEKKARAVMQNHSAMMLYIAPERMQMSDFREDIVALRATNNFCLVAIDEAHCVSEWGHDFRSAYLQIGRSCREMFRKDEFVPPILALTGTASENVLKDVQRDLEIASEKGAIISPPSFNRSELHYSVIPCKVEEKLSKIQTLLNGGIAKKLKRSNKDFKALRGKETDAGLIFTPFAKKKDSSYGAWHVFNELNNNLTDLQLGTYFSEVPPSLNQSDKEEIWQQIIKSYAKEFKDNQKQLLVATKAFGMGIDKSNIRYVIHCGLSSSIEQYYQEAGRAGRDQDNAECFLLFSDFDDKQIEKVLDPECDWEDFKKEYDTLQKKYRGDFSDVSPMLYFHQSNFQGMEYEKDLIFSILARLRIESNDFESFKNGNSCFLTASKIYAAYLLKKHPIADCSSGFEKEVDDFHKSFSHIGVDSYEKVIKTAKSKTNRNEALLYVSECLAEIANKFSDSKQASDMWSKICENLKYLKEDKEKIVAALYKKVERTKKNEENAPILRISGCEQLCIALADKILDKAVSDDIAKAVIRLITLGIIKDYEFDYSKQKYKMFFGDMSRQSILEKYLTFVKGCSSDKIISEREQLSQETCDNDQRFIAKVVHRYVKLVYETIERGRRRALYSMYRLAKDAANQPNVKAQDQFIRETIENYLLADETVEAVKKADTFENRVKEITKAYPLLADEVVENFAEQERSKKAHIYAGRMLEDPNYTNHNGLLFLYAITAIKSRNYHNTDVTNTLIRAYKEAMETYAFSDEIMVFFVKTMNLTFNSSCELFKLLWDKIDSKYVSDIVKTVMELSEDDISKHFKDYLLLHIAAKSLRKMIGEK